MALVEWLLPSMWVEPPTSSRWMAAQQLSIVLVKAQSGKYKHDDHNDQRQDLVEGRRPGGSASRLATDLDGLRKTGKITLSLRHLLCTICTKRRREAKRHLAALPCGKAALPAGGDPHGRFSMRKTILSTATALRRSLFCLPERAKQRKSARKPALRALVSFGRGGKQAQRRTLSLCGQAVRGVARDKTAAPLPKGQFRAAAAVWRPYGLRRTASSSGGLFFWFM